MKTIQFTGTEHKFENLHLALGISDNDMPQQSETRVYVLDTFNVKERNWNDLTDEEFINLAEEDGNVYTLQGFQEAFNSQDINTEIDVIRFINVIKFD
jgi:hypothetical protein